MWLALKDKEAVLFRALTFEIPHSQFIILFNTNVLEKRLGFTYLVCLNNALHLV